MTRLLASLSFGLLLLSSLFAGARGGEPAGPAPEPSERGVQPSDRQSLVRGDLAEAPSPGGSGPEGGPERGEASEGAAEPPVLRLDATALAWLTSLTGYLQTSKGGGAGTTSDDRPTLEEIGLDGLRVLPVVDANVTLFGDHELRGNYVWVGADGSDTLDEDLVSQAVFFPAGSAVESELELHMVRFEYRPWWIIPELGGWRLTPEVGISWDLFTYKLSSPAVTDSVDRSYTVFFPYLGLFVDGPIAGSLRAQVELAGFAGVNGATFLDMDLRLVYRVVESRALDLSVVLGLKGTWFRRRDYQSPQYNDIELMMGAFSTQPWAGLTAGLSLQF